MTSKREVFEFMSANVGYKNKSFYNLADIEINEKAASIKDFCEKNNLWFLQCDFREYGIFNADFKNKITCFADTETCIYKNDRHIPNFRANMMKEVIEAHPEQFRQEIAEFAITIPALNCIIVSVKAEINQHQLMIDIFKILKTRKKSCTVYFHNMEYDTRALISASKNMISAKDIKNSAGWLSTTLVDNSGSTIAYLKDTHGICGKGSLKVLTKTYEKNRMWIMKKGDSGETYNYKIDNSDYQKEQIAYMISDATLLTLLLAETARKWGKSIDNIPSTQSKVSYETCIKYSGIHSLTTADINYFLNSKYYTKNVFLLKKEIKGILITAKNAGEGMLKWKYATDYNLLHTEIHEIGKYSGLELWHHTSNDENTERTEHTLHQIAVILCENEVRNINTYQLMLERNLYTFGYNLMNKLYVPDTATFVVRQSGNDDKEYEMIIKCWERFDPEKEYSEIYESKNYKDVFYVLVDKRIENRSIKGFQYSIRQLFLYHGFGGNYEISGNCKCFTVKIINRLIKLKDLKKHEDSIVYPQFKIKMSCGKDTKKMLDAYNLQKKLRLTIRCSQTAYSVLNFNKGISEKFGHCSPLMFRFIKEAAIGGYTYLNPNYVGNKVKVLPLDYNSAYPAIMQGEGTQDSRKFYIPCKEPKKNDTVLIDEDYINDDREYMIARIKFKKDAYLKQFYPPTVRNEKTSISKIDFLQNIIDTITVSVDSMYNDKSDFNNNYLEYISSETVRVMSKPDIRNLIKSYDINLSDIDFLEIYTAETSQILFKDYINYFYKVKDEQKKLKLMHDEKFSQNLYDLSKIVLNSVYGKTGQDDMRLTAEIKSFNKGKFMDSQKETAQDENGKYIKFLAYDKETGLEHINKPAWISQSITAFQRERICDLNRKIIDLGYKVAYNDTDSIKIVIPENENIILKNVKYFNNSIESADLYAIKNNNEEINLDIHIDNFKLGELGFEFPESKKNSEFSKKMALNLPNFIGFGKKVYALFYDNDIENAEFKLSGFNINTTQPNEKNYINPDELLNSLQKEEMTLKTKISSKTQSSFITIGNSNKTIIRHKLYLAENGRYFWNANILNGLVTFDGKTWLNYRKAGENQCQD